MFLLGYIGAPPTIFVISAKAGATNVGAAMATLAASAAAKSGILAFMGLTPFAQKPIEAVFVSIGTSWLRSRAGGVSDFAQKNHETTFRPFRETSALRAGIV